MPSSLRHALAELKRRKVYRAAIVYAAAAFVVWQVAEIALPSLGLPDSTVTLVVALTILGFPVALVLAWSYELKPEEESLAAEVRGPAPPPEGTDARRSSRPAVAVLPFDNMSPAPDSEYFADGITEELTTALSRVPSLLVAARTSAFSFKGERVDVREIGARLGVTHVVEGSVRRAGDILRVTAQLIETREGYHLWSHRFENRMDDVFRVQDAIVDSVLANLLPRLHDPVRTHDPASAPRLAEAGDSPERAPPLPRTDDLDAYDQYLRGLHELRRFDGPSLARGVEHLSRTTELDATFAPASASLAEALTMQAIGFSQRDATELLPRARQAAERAIELDPGLPQAHVARALSLLYHDRAYAEALGELRRAIELSPSCVEAHRWSEFYWTYVEHDSDRAMAALDRAHELDPLDQRITQRRATVHYIFGRYQEAEALFRTMLEAAPGAIVARLGLIDTLVRAGKTREATALALQVPADDRVPRAALGVAGVALALGGETGPATEILGLLGHGGSGPVGAPFWEAVILAALGRMDEAFACFDRADEVRDAALLYLWVVPPIPGLRDDPRYAALVRKIGLGHLLAE